MGKSFSLTSGEFKINYRILGICKDMSEKDTKHCAICLATDCKHSKVDKSELHSNGKDVIATLTVPDTHKEKI